VIADCGLGIADWALAQASSPKPETRNLKSVIRWRLLLTGPADGPTNMALDEAIMEAVDAGQVPPTLRLYGWQPPCLSIGRFQAVAGAVDVDACRVRGFDLVRRPTGGRAILHDTPARELTYSLAIPQNDPRVAGDVPASYRAISAALVRGLARLGIAAQLAPAREGPLHPETAACFDQPSDYEVTVDGRKLVGSAQARSGGVLLQHGTVLLDVDLTAWVAVLRPPAGLSPAAFQEHLAGRLTSLRHILGRRVAFDETANALANGFRETFGVALEPGALIEVEQRRAEALRREKYAVGSWTFRR
jgi:lipoate-protein ligase A